MTYWPAWKESKSKWLRNKEGWVCLLRKGERHHYHSGCRVHTIQTLISCWLRAWPIKSDLDSRSLGIVLSAQWFHGVVKWAIQIFYLQNKMKDILVLEQGQNNLCLMVPQTVTVLCNLSWHCWQYRVFCQTPYLSKQYTKDHSKWHGQLHHLSSLTNSFKHYGSASKTAEAKKGVDKQ